jgi:glycyl-tRNA synthetase beta chain
VRARPGKPDPVAEFLLELRSEEIPARMQARAAEDLKRLVTERLTADGIDFKQARSFVTPRRIALVIEGLPLSQPDTREERRGPRTDAPDRAVEGFLKSAGLSKDALEVRQTDRGSFYFAVIERKGRPTAKALAAILPDTLAVLPWPKSMRWGDHECRWVRPLHGILCLFNNQVVPFRFGPVAAGDTTLGHRTLGPGEIRVKDFDDYKAKLEGAGVTLDAGERREAIRRGMERLATEEGLAVRDDPGLLSEVAGLVEWPVVLLGRIDESFLELPSEVLTTSMRHHLKYFSLLKDDGSLAPRFVVVANIEAEDGGKRIVTGNERVLRARLTDARFFWDQDRRTKLEERVPELKGMIFHAKLGAVSDRVTRLQTLAAELAPSVPGANIDLARSAALLCKADLVTNMVREFPELQGIMGRYYALAEGERAEVADAIADHYSPAGPNDRCPAAPVSVALALADRIDSLVGFFAIGARPTGSKDPYALRRAALGAIRLIVENGLRLSLCALFDRAYSLYLEQEQAGFSPSKTPEGAPREALAGSLMEFFTDRLKVHLREKGVRHDLIDAVYAVRRANGEMEDDLVRLLARVEALSRFLQSEDGANLLIAYRRAGNIVGIEEKKDGRSHDGAVAPAAFAQDEEKALFNGLNEVEGRVARSLANEEFGAAMAAMARLRRPLDAFFDKVTVNCDDPERRINRLRLLSRIRTAFGGIADFSKAER